MALAATAKEPAPYDGLDVLVPTEADEPVVWGLPLKGGAFRALFIAPRYTLGDASELARRLDLDFDVVPLWDTCHVGGDVQFARDAIPGASEAETLAMLRACLRRRSDLIVIGNLDPSLLPDDVLETIVGQVRQGTGLLAATYGTGLPKALEPLRDVVAPAGESTPAVLRGIGESFMPEWRDGLGFVKAGVLDAGRIVLLEYGEPLPLFHCLLPGLKSPLQAEPQFHDNYLSLVAKAACWAVKRDPESRDQAAWIDRVEVGVTRELDPNDIPPDFAPEAIQRMRDVATRLPCQQYTVQLNSAAKRHYRVTAQVRRPGRDWRTKYSFDVPKGADSFPVTFLLGPGRYFLDLWLLDDGKTLDWHTAAVTVEGWPELGLVSFSKASLLPHDTLGIEFDVRPLSKGPRPCRAYARALDGLGRLVAEKDQSVPAEGGRTTLLMEFADLVAPQVRVEVFLLEGVDIALTEWALNRAAYATTLLPVRRAPQTAFGLWAEGDGSAEHNARAFNKSLASAGVDTLVTRFGTSVGIEEAWTCATECGLRLLPTLADYSPISIRDGLVREPCLSDPTYLGTEHERLLSAAKSLKSLGVSLCSLGSGNCLTGDGENVCQSPSCLDGFRAALRTQYGSLASLNAAWGTQLDSWDAVRPAPPDVAATLHAYAPWMDFRRYMETVFCAAHKNGRAALVAGDSDARVGFSGRPNATSFQGYDWRALTTELDLVGIPPEHALIEKVRSYNSSKKQAAVLCGGLTGSPTDAAQAEWLPWHALLHGMASLWWTNSYGTSGQVSPGMALAPDGTPLPRFSELAESVNQMRGSGIATLLSRATRKPARIALYDSTASRLLNEIAQDSGIKTPQAENAFADALADLGYAFDSISSETATQPGALNAYKFLILPMARALGDSEVEAIRQFHASGGHVLADIVPGEFDGHGAPRERPALDDVLGAKSAGSAELAEGALPGNDRTTATLINHPISPYSRKRHDSQSQALRHLLDSALQAAGVARETGLAQEPPHGLAGECFAYRYDDVDLVAVLRSPGKGEEGGEIKISLPDAVAAYDMLAGLRVGHPRKISVGLPPGKLALYAGLPYEVSRVQLGAPKITFAGKRLPVRIALTTQGPPPGEHVVHIELIRPAPQGPTGAAPPARDSLKHYADDIVCPGGKGETYIPLAINEAPGVYTLVARDVLSGVSAQYLVEITSPKAPRYANPKTPRPRRPDATPGK